MSKRQQIVRRGDIVEITTQQGLAYAQFINVHKNKPLTFGDLVRVLPGVYRARPTDVASLVEAEGGWCCFWDIRHAVKQSEVTVVGHAKIPREFERMPTFKLATRHLRTKRVLGWAIWNGKTISGKPVSRLTKEQRSFPLAEIIHTEDVIRRIEIAWTPTDECKAGATSIYRPLIS
jgi:hypothetical protein